MRNEWRGVRRAGAVLALGLAMAGCQRARVAEPLTGPLGGNEPAVQMDFWHGLAERPVLSNDEAFHALLLYLDGSDPAGDYAGRKAALRQRGLLASGFDRPAEEAVDRGTLAVALVRAMDIEGGVVMRLVGPRPRYATRELQYLNIYPASSPWQTFSGPEFLDVIGRAEDFERRLAVKAPATQIAPEAQAPQVIEGQDQPAPEGSTPGFDASAEETAEDAAPVEEGEEQVDEQP